jgi:DNA polymerase elongation subunit (family B)
VYRNCVYNNRERCVHLFSWDADGNRVKYDLDFNPYLFLEKPNGEEESIFKTKLTKREFDTGFERNKFLKDSNVKRIFENLPPAQQFLIDNYWHQNNEEDFSKHPLKVMFIDIETFSNKGKFPDIQNPEDIINLITCYDSIKERYVTFGLKPFDASHITDKKIKYIHCKSEELLLKAFIKFWEMDYPDVVSGWNSSGFDMPYIINRIAVVLDEEWQKRLSPIGRIYEKVKKRVKFGEPPIQFVIEGVSSVDYMVLYQKFKLDKQESYKLDFIAEVELGKNKIEYEGQLWELSIRDWKTFVDYNILDVELLVRLDDELRYMKTLRFLANIGLTNIEKAIDTVPIMNGALAVQARKRNQRIPTFIKPLKIGKNPGAYVREPKRGISENLVSFDANSLYPSVMISLNLSPETKIGRYEEFENTYKIYHVTGRVYEFDKEKFENYIKAEQVVFTKAGFLFSQKRKGIVPEYLDWLYSERQKMQKAMKDCKTKLKEDKTLSKKERSFIQSEQNRYDSIQYAYKINLNSLYGYMGNAYAPMGDDDIASSVTLTGQAVIKNSNDIFQKSLIEKYPDLTQYELNDSIIYNDTDSLYVSLKCLDKKGIPIYKNDEINPDFLNFCDYIENYINTEMINWAKEDLKSIDPRFVFKRETICDSGIFLKKKYYVLHMIDDEGFKVDKFKYKGVSVVKTTMPKKLKPYLKEIIESMIIDKNKVTSDDLFNQAYETFKTLPHEMISRISGINTFDKYISECTGFEKIAKGMQEHMKAAYYHNVLLEKLELSGKYPILKQGDKIKYINVKKQNRYNINVVGYGGNYPEEFKKEFEIDYEKMFENLMYRNIEFFYEAVGWILRKPNENVKVDLLDFFSED